MPFEGLLKVAYKLSQSHSHSVLSHGMDEIERKLSCVIGVAPPIEKMYGSRE